ncbi:hypothetical protein S83_065225, partial [Arachis hypogaea]
PLTHQPPHFNSNFTPNLHPTTKSLPVYHNRHCHQAEGPPTGGWKEAGLVVWSVSSAGLVGGSCSINITKAALFCRRDLDAFSTLCCSEFVLIMANVDTPTDALTTRQNSAQKIRLCRTEHMFLASDESIKAVRLMIVAITPKQKKVAIDLLLPYQRSDFEGIFHAMDGLPVTIQLLDPPLHEFIPEGELHHIVRELTSETGINEEEIFSRIEKLSKVYPMLGCRGCRLGISYLKLTEMQVRAIFEIAVLVSNHGIKGQSETMVPLELKYQVSLIRNFFVKVFFETGSSLSYRVGIMIEIAKEAEFFSFRTNDLIQMIFGYSRDDFGKFLSLYLSIIDLKNFCEEQNSEMRMERVWRIKKYWSIFKYFDP